MVKRSFYASLATLGLLGANAHAAVTLLDKDGWKVQLGGFAELDVFTDSTRSFNESTNNGPVAKGGTYKGDNGSTEMSVANSRLAFSVLPPAVDGWQTKGYIEGDFLGPNAAATESKIFTNPEFRVRHAYVSTETSSWQFLAGQYWSLLGWQTYYLQPTVAVPASVGSLYERTPQLTAIATQKLGSLGVQGALSVERPVQRDSQIPDLNAGVRLAFDGWRGALANSPTGDEITAPLSVALTGTARDFKINAGDGVSTTASSHQEGYAVAVDAYVPILPAGDKDPGNSLVLIGEFTTGKGYGEMFPGYSGGLPQLTATDGSFKIKDTNLDPGLGYVDGSGFHLVNLQSYNATVQYHLPTDWHTWINVGYAKLKSDNIAGAGGAATYTDNEFYFGNVYHDLSKQVRVALEYSYAKTTYADGSNGHNNRYQASFWYRF